VPVTDELYVLFGIGEVAGNIAASIGEDGVLIVDDQSPAMTPLYKDSIRELGGNDIDFVINSHWHYDHADGNKALGPDGSWIVAQANSRRMLLQDNKINLVFQVGDQPAYPPAALPVITYDDHMSFHFNGQQIDLFHFNEAHTTGDTATIFRGDNAVHLGDVFNNAGYPFIDADNGGSLPGLIQFCEAVLAEIDEGTVVIPGHGPVAGYERLQDYAATLATIRDRIAALIAQGASLENVIEAAPTAEFDASWGDPGMFINRAYTSMTR
jgi:glyoxylase-like metal-dependent hydrolase (beta-lactamase superfamily II)